MHHPAKPGTTPLLAILTGGAAALALAFAAGILAVALFSHINIGIRHVLPIYIAFAIGGATGAVRSTNGGAGWST